MEIITGILALIVLIGIKLHIDEKKRQERLHARLLAEWGKERDEEYSSDRMTAAAAYYQSQKRNGDVDDITWNDLDLDRIYQKVNHTCSAMGQEYLYALLRQPSLEDSVLQERERLIVFFGEREAERLMIQKKLTAVGKMGKFSVFWYITRIEDLKEENSGIHILQFAAFALCVCLCFVFPTRMAFPTATVAVVNMVSYYRRKAQIEQYYKLFAFIIKMVHFSEDMAKLDIPELRGYLEQFGETAGRFQRFCRGSWVVVGGGSMDGSLLDTLMDYVRLLTHIDIIKFQSMAREAIRLRESLITMYELTGFLDSMAAAASYRAMMPDHCVPELDRRSSYPGVPEAFSHPGGSLGEQASASRGRLEAEGSSHLGGILEAEGLYHPLIAQPVKNNISAHRSILLTGSNASGKSTFIKTVAVNAILAQTIHTVLADCYHADHFRVYSSMALRDDITGNESYYMVEIRSLKRIVDQSLQRGAPVLCLIDEVLRGTNTVERIAASTEILDMLAGMNALCFAATHDIELTDLLGQKYDDYHFEEQIRGDDVIFDYRLRKGKAMTRNAIRLLKMIGYDPEIVRRSEKRVEDFLRTGSWIRSKDHAGAPSRRLSGMESSLDLGGLL